MRQCEFCRMALPDQATFCGHCGRAQADVTEVSEYPTVDLNDEDEEEKRRRAALLGLSLPVAADLAMQARGANVPMVEGTPQVGGVPTVPNTPHIPSHHQPSQTIPSHHQPSHAVPSHHQPSAQDILSQPTRHFHSSPKSRAGAGSLAQVLLVIAVTFTLIVAGIVGAGLTILSPVLSLSGSTNVAWGQSIHLYGSHFIPGSSVVLTLDGTQPLYYASREPAIQVSSNTTNLAMLVAHISQIDASKNAVVVSADGTFNLTINVSSNWQAGHHTIRAEEQISRRSAVLNFTVEQPAQTPTLTPALSPTGTPSPTDTPTPVGTPSPTAIPSASPSPSPSPTASVVRLSCVTPTSITLTANQGSNQSNSKKLTLCTSGSGLLNWTASWNQNQASWLHLDHSSGQIQAPGQGQVNVSAQANGLKAGKYTTTVTFSSQPGASRVSLDVTFTVQASCVSVTPGTLSFTGVVANGDPQTQTVTVSNCGSVAGDWSMSSDSNWLTTNPTSGTLDGGAKQQVDVAVSLANLKIGTYNGQIVFKLGSSQSTVDVTLTLQAPTLSASPTSISANNDCSSSSALSVSGWVCHVTLSNNGAVQGNLNWSASSSGVAGITFTPSSGTLAPGASVQVEVGVPSVSCPGSAALSFVGPANTVNVTVDWSCSSS